MVEFESRLNVFSNNLKKLQIEIDGIKKLGVSDEILVCWLVVKLKVSQKDARNIIHCVEEFYNNFLSKEVINQL
ncbi:MAG: hypothetical protein ACP5D2_02125 [Candidatus Nanoarchaeia archaeon]